MRVVLIGEGRTLHFLARRFLGKNFHVTLIVRDDVEARRHARDLKATVLLGDGTTPTLLRDAEASRADAVVTLMPRDEDNLVACQVARRMYGVPHVVSLVNDPANVELFHRLDVRATFSSTDLLARIIEERTATTEVLSLLPLADGRAHVTEVLLPEGAPAAGRRLQDLDVPEGALVASVIRGDRLTVPGGPTVLEVGDRLVLVSQPQNYGRFLRLLLGGNG